MRAAGFIHRSMNLSHVLGKWTRGKRDRRHVLVGLKGVTSVAGLDEGKREALFRKDGEHLQAYIDVLDPTPEPLN